MHGATISNVVTSRPSLWISILKEFSLLKDRGIDLMSHCHVGNGLRTQFWNEVWIAGAPLRVLFPRIYALESFKDCTVASKLQSSVSHSLRRDVRGGVESSQIVQLEEIIGTVILSNMEDRWTWDLNSDRVFRVKDVLNILDDHFLPKSSVATRWIKYVPIKINVFAWKLFLDCLPTRSNLLLRGVNVPDSSCTVCASAQETAAHLFFSCDLSLDVSRLICQWWNVVWSPIGSFSEWLTWFQSIRLNSLAKRLLEGVFLCVVVEYLDVPKSGFVLGRGCDVALETLPANMEVGEKTALMKKAYSTLILCLGDRVLREVTKETTAAGIWTKLTSLYMTKSLANRLYLKKKRYTYYMSPCTKLGDHIDEFNKLILDLANIDIEIEDEDQTLMLLTSFPSSYENFMETVLYGRESLTMEDVLATLNSRKLKKRTKGTKEEISDGLYVRGRSDYSGKAHSSGSSRFKLRGGTSKLKFFICHSDGHLKRDCLMNKSSGFVKKGKRDQHSDNEGNVYFGEAMVIVRNDEMTELVTDSGGSYHMTHMRDFLYDFKVVDGGSVQLGDNRTCTIKGTGKVKIQLHDGSSFILEDVRAQGDREAEVFQVSNDDVVVAQRRLEDKQLEEKTNTDCLVKEQENVRLGIKVRENIMVTGVPGQEGAEGNVAEKKKVKESIKTNLEKLLKRFNDYPPRAHYHTTSFNGVTMGYLEKNLTQEQTQYQAHYSGINLQTNYKYSVTEVGESSNGFIVNQQVEKSPIGLSLSKSTPVLSEPPEFSEEIDCTAKMHTKWHPTKDEFTGGQASIYSVHTVKCPPGVLNKPFSDLLSSNSYLQSLSQQPFPRHSPPFHNLNGLVYSAKQCQYASSSNPVTNHGNHQGGFIDYVPNVVQPGSCLVGNFYPNLPSPAFNQIARRGSHETPGTNGVTPLALNQIATRDSYENPRLNGVDTPALNQVETGDSYINPRTNGVIPQALNQITMGDIYKDPRINGVWVQRGNAPIQDMLLIADFETENLPQYNNEQTFLNDKQRNKPVNQSYLMNPNADHPSFVDRSMLPDGVAIPMIDSGVEKSYTGLKHNHN
nr:RNA-directed DNA polymerase, eukaryota [Tanacetum cinerariifolium]